MAKLQKMSDEEFYDILKEIVTMQEVLSVPGVFELLRKYFNNEVLEEWAERKRND